MVRSRAAARSENNADGSHHISIGGIADSMYRDDVSLESTAG
jgi:hypothetical protein